jgi:hypothetical protein
MNQLAFAVQPSTIPAPHILRDPEPIAKGTVTSWPGGLDPEVPLYAGNPVPLSMGSTMSKNRRQSGGKRCWSRSRKNLRKNSRKNSRKNTRKNRKGSRKNSRKNTRKNRKGSRKNLRKSNRRH